MGLEFRLQSRVPKSVASNRYAGHSAVRLELWTRTAPTLSRLVTLEIAKPPPGVYDLLGLGWGSRIGSLNMVIIWFLPPLFFIKPKLSDVTGLRAPWMLTCTWLCARYRGLGLKWTPHQWHPLCISGISQFQNHFMMVYKPGIWSLADRMSNPLLFCCPFLYWLKRRPGRGGRNSLCSHIYWLWSQSERISTSLPS